MISMTKNDMRCNVLSHQGDANEGFIAMHAFVRYLRYQIAGHSLLGMLHTNSPRLSVISWGLARFIGMSTLMHNLNRVRISSFHPLSISISTLFVRVLSTHIISMQCLCRIGTYKVNPFDSTFNINAHASECHLYIL